MKIGIGLPSAVPGTDGAQMAEWARRAEAAGFSTLGTIDRLVYPNHEPLVALTYAAAVTERIGLLTSILLAPLRANAALLAKQAASIDVLSGGRLTLGMAVGGRVDDFEASGVEFHQRGQIFDQQLEEMARIWDGDAIGPEPGPGRPEVVIGGQADVSFKRAARHAGWMMGGGPPDRFPGSVEKLEAAWSAAGRDGEPRKLALGYYGLGNAAREQIHGYITHYYAFLGDFAAQMAAGIPADPASVKDRVAAFEQVGCDELVLFPSSADAAQVDLLADTVL
jgi:alkanesulfonate monooxygenase SsuD/methylene tetrahydromethanopterin reductase-like flavin-dependent oxidoreductase (luciferase family)